MWTYRRESERKGWWHRPWPVRVLSVLVGVCLVLFGMVLWGLEQEEGGWEGSGLGHHVVGYDELTDEVVVWNEDGEIVFRGTDMGEADAWIESQRSRDFTVPILVMAGGGLLIALGVAPSPATQDHVVGGPLDRTISGGMPVDARWTPWRAQLGDWRWWVVVGLTGVISFGIAFFAALVLAFSIAYDMQTPWDVIIVYTPLAFAGLATAAIGGVRRWWLIIPAGVAYLLPLLQLVDGALENELVMATIAWVLIVGSTALIRWFVAGPSPHNRERSNDAPRVDVPS